MKNDRGGAMAGGSVSEREQRVPELDGVRGLAILLVLGFHFARRPLLVPRFVTAPFALGWSGVDLFFVLSGFLITGILLDTKQASNYFSSFYARRVLRVWPLYLAALAAFFFVALPAAHHFGYWTLENNALQWWYWFHVSNWQSAFGHDIELLTHLWSLAIEEQFYVFWPLIVFALPRSKLSAVCCALIVASFGLRCGFQGDLVAHSDLLNRLTPFRLDTLAFGGLVAIIVRSETLSSRLKTGLPWIAATAGIMLVAALIIARSVAVSSALVATVGFTLLAILYANLVFFAYTYSGSTKWLCRKLRSRSLLAFGKYSYGIYVLHYPIARYHNQLLLAVADRIPTGLHTIVWVLSQLLGVGVSYAIAVGSWNLIEKRVLRHKKRFATTFVAGCQAAVTPGST